LFAAPILWLTSNPVLAVNLVALAGAAAWRLCARSASGSIGARPSSAARVAFAPARFVGQAYLGTLQWIPFTLAALHRKSIVDAAEPAVGGGVVHAAGPDQRAWRGAFTIAGVKTSCIA
jgi:hypothetical protein